MTKYIKLFEQWDALGDGSNSAKIVFVGDIMQHDRQLKFEQERGFSYKGVFDSVKQLFNGCDLVVGNLETTIRDHVSGFPNFSATKELLYALKQSGFDVLITSNNHSLDFGEDGIKSTYKSIKDVGMIPIGSMGIRSRTFNINGNLITIHSYTTFVNEERSSDLLSFWIDEVRKKEGINIAYIHSGKEFTDSITPEQEKIVRILKDEGFDGVIFTHSHIPGPLQWDKDFFVVFGMGNFISDQLSIKGPEHGNCIILEVFNGGVKDIKVIKTSSVVQNNGETRVLIDG